MKRLHRGLIVSCQAEQGSPFNATEFIVAFAKAAELGGAVAVRIRGIENVRAVRRAVRLPIIGLTKGTFPSGLVLVTPTQEEVEDLFEAGADIVAVDATSRTRPSGLTGPDFLRNAKEETDGLFMADISNYDEALKAAQNGADYIGTTLSGYTEATKVKPKEPDLDLIRQLADSVRVPVIAEGRIWTPEQAREAIELGAHAVCVGTAITRPVEIVRRFSSVMSEELPSSGATHPDD